MAGLSSLLRSTPHLACIGTALVLAGCSSLNAKDSFLGVVTPYRIDIVQGNVVTAEQAAQIRPGMSRTQVRDILGSPMLTDIFHADRWDYVFTITRPGVTPQRRTVVAHFKDDRLERLEAPELPSEREYVATMLPPTEKGSAPALELSDAQRKALPAPVRAEAMPADVPGPKRIYPPLEPS